MTFSDFSGDGHAGVAGNATTATIADYDHLLVETASRIQFVTTPTRHGAYSKRIELRQNDFEHSGTSERTEATATAIRWVDGDEGWLAISIWLDSAFTFPPMWGVLHQLFADHSGTGGGSPPFAIEVSPSGIFQITVRGGNKALNTDPSPSDTGYNLPTATLGVWHDFLVHIKWSTTASGLVEVWHRVAGGSFASTPDVSHSGVNVTSVAGVAYGVYPETGYYRSTQPETCIVYHGGLWGRTSRAAAEVFWTPVAAGGSARPGLHLAGALGLGGIEDVVRFAYLSVPLSVSFLMPDIVTSDITGFARVTSLSGTTRLTSLSVAEQPADA